MFKNLSKTTKLFSGLIAGVLLVMIIMISISGNRTSEQQQAHYINDNASADNKVEALKTMTADLVNVENENKQLQKNVQQLQSQNNTSVVNLKKAVALQMKQALAKIQSQNQTNQKSEGNQKMLINKDTGQNKKYFVDGVNDDVDRDSFVWISDLSQPAGIKNNNNKFSDNSFLNFVTGNQNNNKNSLLHNGKKNLLDQDSNSKKDLVKPAYTIPVNATLTGAVLMTPLVGRIPIDGQLPSPYHFKLVLSSENLTANGYPMPGVKGAVMSGVASGDLLGSCSRGDIHSITFIFSDGTISTTQTKSNDNSLGYISSQTGNPCIAGTFHSDAAIFLGAQMAFAGAQGYANAITDSQYMTSTNSDGNNIRTLIGSANKAAIGQGGSAAAQAAQTWWNRRVQNSFDYVYVSNVDSKTGHPMKVVVNISKQISINHDSNARKVSYENALQTNNSWLD
ncbi:MAG: TIGR03752 family integrating conjugative element protein [Gammaproteobacteria bacterium CG_4_10_14_0_8_um_filter_38_16]|nr:MAG: TIGR03752 family integrating conjugative element protein [Gammaproteobacteria bacterium CG_4_10_14_0_8_um_filter_38_16]PJA04225.1 MAG: TIGR03752 family integrating conjugative element protein [Gammaproteobacteria bacterium CG_4_10_14_0_2_um_filter_38_22]PJB11060.1 MAG: TIGR03752 family integrating conjugative element protein [Gammaproteobacteria bacterium CG_4_9_14_3_um_filter_38_9]